MSTLYRTYSDSVDPNQLPAGQPGAVYINGHYAATEIEVAHLSHVLWIDVVGDRPDANMLDIEHLDATPGDAPRWVREHVEHEGGPEKAISRLYCDRSDWPWVRLAVAGLPYELRKTIRFAIADPTGVSHLIPGSDSTQYAWGATRDLNVCVERFWPALWQLSPEEDPLF